MAALDPALAAAAPGGVLVVDFGAQYSQLIARRIRECRVVRLPCCTTRRPTRSSRSSRPASCCRAPASVYEPGAPALDRASWSWGSRCWASATACRRWPRRFGEVTRTGAGEFGKTALTVRSRRGIFGDLAAEVCWMSHRDAVARPPDGFAVTAETPGSPVAAMESRARGLYAVQFHPEVVHTPSAPTS